MKILIFNWRDIKNPAAGGAEVVTHEIGKRIVEKGHAVCLFTSSFRGCSKRETIDGVEITRSGSRYTVYRNARRYYAKNSGAFDLVIDEINTIPFMTPKFVLNGTPVVALIHQLAREFWCYETPFPVSWLGYHWLEDRWLKNYREVPTLTVSESTRQDLIDLGFENITIIPEGLNIKPLPDVPEKEEMPTFIFVGRMGHAKRPDHALEAFTCIKEKIPAAKLWMVGDGAMRQKLEKSRPDGVTFFGRVDGETKYKLMSRAHAILVPGVREGWGLVVTEAAAVGTPAVGYDVHGLRDSIRSGVTGLLCAPEPGAMAQRAVELVQDEGMREKLSANALKWAREFDWDRSAEEVLKVIDNFKGGLYEDKILSGG